MCAHTYAHTHARGQKVAASSLAELAAHDEGDEGDEGDECDAGDEGYK